MWPIIAPVLSAQIRKFLSCLTGHYGSGSSRRSAQVSTILIFAIMTNTGAAAAIKPNISAPKALINADHNAVINTASLVTKAPDNTKPVAVLVDAYQRYYQQALTKNLAQHRSWRRMLYFTDAPQRHQQADISAVNDPEFFVSESGRYDPKAELLALLKLMTVQPTSAAELAKRQTILCRFPARTHWLQRQLSIAQSDLVAPNCADFDVWMAKLDPQRLSVVFAEEYLDNPLSAFGHTLMLIDSTKSLADPSAIDHAYALNDTVAGNPEDNFIIYAAKSITGLYTNDITIDPLPSKLASYLRHDNRDVWRYPLALSRDEVQQIMRHVWESKDLALPYYFTTDNCASEILRYIDIVRPTGNLLGQLPYVVVPSDVVRLLTSAGLISKRQYLPSDDSLDQANRNALKTAKPNDSLSTVGSQDRLAVFPDTVIGFDDRLIPTSIIPADNNPNQAHLLSRGMVGVGRSGHDDAALDYLSFGVRAGFNDLLDPPVGYPQNFDLEALSVDFRIYDNKYQAGHQNDFKDRIKLQALTLIRGRSFNPINTAKSGKTWGIHLGATRVKDGATLAGQDHLVANAAYEQGVSVSFGTPKLGSGELPPQLCFALGSGLAQVGGGISKGWRIGAGVNLGCRYQISPKLRSHLEFQLRYWYHGEDNQIARGEIKGHYWQPSVRLGVQYDISPNQALRLQGNHKLQDSRHDSTDLQLSYVRYF